MGRCKLCNHHDAHRVCILQVPAHGPGQPAPQAALVRRHQPGAGAAGRQLQLGPRYLLCGNSIVYYANVNRLTLSGANGTLRLQSQNGKSFVLERDKFPTGARKADKIKKNKAAKFDKVSSKIIEKVKKAAPRVDMIGT